jgi:hypothetical protein
MPDSWDVAAELAANSPPITTQPPTAALMTLDIGSRRAQPSYPKPNLIMIES